MKLYRVLKIVGIIGSVVVLVMLLSLAWLWNRIESSLPLLEGEFQITGLSAPAQLERDDLGIAIVHAANRIDAARALGFAHAQDRFFQMDLSRRRAAAELAPLVGDAALGLDRATVGHRFRDLAEQAIALLPAAQRIELAAYAEGANAGLAALPRSPWEYGILRAEPEKWTTADSALVFYSMVLELQDATGSYEQTLSALRDVMGTVSVDFFNPLIGPHDSAFDGSTAPLRAPPSPAIIDLQVSETLPELQTAAAADHHIIGSNAFVLSGDHTRHQGAIVGGDPHLGLQIPNTWYRAQLNWTLADGSPHRVEGVSIPGIPGIIIGTNGHIAWTFTNATVDTGDLVAVDLNQVAPEILYYFQGDSVEFDERVDLITRRDGSTEEVLSTWTHFGPIVGRTVRGKPLAYRWTFHDPTALNFDVLGLMEATSVDEAIALSGESGMPNQNLFVADATGEAAWALTGKLPRRFGFDGQYPVSWTFGDRGWDGYLNPEERPVWRASADQLLWSGNQRKVSGEALARIGDNGYDDAARADQIKRRLDDLTTDASPADLMAVQLDFRADWAQRWHRLLLETLRSDDVATTDPIAQEVVRVLAAWEGDAASSSAAYRIVRRWNRLLAGSTLTPIFAKVVRQDPAFRYSRLRYDEALWALHRDEPAHLVGPPFGDWASLRAHVALTLLEEIDDAGGVDRYTWGEANRLDMIHPFARLVPDWLGDFISMPPTPQSGDRKIPRVARPRHGASLRFAVAPDQPEEGILHLPAGQSGNPRSPYFRAGHDDWVRGELTPLQPGEPQHRLILQP
jgi:penicillin G amidase